MKASEPTATYNTAYIQGLKNRLIASIDASTDEDKLRQCLHLLDSSSKDMPCVFTDEEFEEEVRLSEESGYATEEDLKRVFGKWNL